MRLKLGVNNLPVEIFAKYNINEITIPVEGLEKDVICRLRDTDPEVFNQVFVHNEYQHPMLPETAHFILDAGANVGYSVLFFRRLYPDATILALEPDPVNYQMLCKNCDHLSNVILLNAALWKVNTKLELSFTNEAGHKLNSWGVQTHEITTLNANSSDLTDAYDVPTLMKKYGVTEIDICKVDIEGAEKEVFENPNADWYDKVKLFTLETHERFATGSDAAVKSALTLDKWAYARKRENQFFKRIL